MDKMGHERRSSAGGVRARLSRLLGSSAKEKPPIIHTQSSPAPGVAVAAADKVLVGADIRPKYKSTSEINNAPLQPAIPEDAWHSEDRRGEETERQAASSPGAQIAPPAEEVAPPPEQQAAPPPKDQVVAPPEEPPLLAPGLHESYTPPNSQRAVVDIVVIHGLTGSATKTWLHLPSRVYWPRDLLKNDFPDARVLVFQYDANITGIFSPASSNRLSDHAENMLGDLARLREGTDTEDRRLIFVAHSLGGLVVQKALTLSRASPLQHIQQVEKNTAALLFLGTPHHGAELARWGTYAGNLWKLVCHTNAEIIQTLRPDSEILANVQHDFQSLLRSRIDERNGLDISCFYEELPVRGVGMIVPKHSAQLLPYGSYGIHTDHKDMGKFSGLSDPGYRALKGEILRPVHKLRREATVRLTPLQEECLRNLHYPDMDGRLEQIKDAASSTFAWVWTAQSFETWLKSGGGLYWIAGKPGSGKSTMIKHLSGHPRTYDTLCEINSGNRAVRPIIAVHCFDHSIASDSPHNRSLDGMLRSLLTQIITHDPSRGQPVFDAFDMMKRRQSSLRWSTFKLLQLLLRVIEATSDHPLCLFIDALDECEEASASDSGTSIAECIYLINRALQQRGRLCISSRSLAYSYELRTTPKFILDRHTAADISTYVHAKLGPMLDEEESKYSELAGQLVNQANGVFLWVRLAAEMLLKSWIRKESFSKLKERLFELPRNLTNLYGRIFEDLSADDRQEAHLLLGLVASSKAPLTVANISDLLNLAGYETTEDYSARIQTVCLGLLDVRNQVLRPSHQTVLEYLKQKLPEAMQAGNSLLLKACLLQWMRHEKPTKGSFARYATLHWLAHARQNPNQETGDTKPMSNLEFLRWYEVFLTISDPAGTAEANPSGRGEPKDGEGWTVEIAARRLLEILLFRSINRSIVQKNRVVFPIGLERHYPRQILHDVGSGLDLRVALDAYSHPLQGSTFLGVSNELVTTKMDWTISNIKSTSEKNTDLFQTYLETGTDSLDSARIVERPSYCNPLEPNSDASIKLGIWLYSPEEFRAISNICASARQDQKWGSRVPGQVTPLQLACWLGMSKTVKLMLENGADPSLIRAGSAFGTPLLACIAGQWERSNLYNYFTYCSTLPFRFNCMVLLLEAGADPNQQGQGMVFGRSLSPTDLAVERWAADLDEKPSEYPAVALAEYVTSQVALDSTPGMWSLTRHSRKPYMIHGLYAYGGYPSLRIRKLIASSDFLSQFFHYASFTFKHTYKIHWDRDLLFFEDDLFPEAAPSRPRKPASWRTSYYNSNNYQLDKKPKRNNRAVTTGYENTRLCSAQRSQRHIVADNEE